MDKYMIVFRWLAQVGGASSCMYLTETRDNCNAIASYTHCVPAVFFEINSFSYPEYSVIWTPSGPTVSR